MIPRIVRLRIAAFAAALALPLAMGACSGSPSGPELGDVQALVQARADWTRHGASSYTFVARPMCFCGDARQIRTTVVNRAVTQRVYVDDGSPVPANFFTGIATVASMLDTVEDALNKGAAAVDVTYDSRGIPTKAAIDYQSNMADEEFGWVVTSYTPTP
ncbi:hypothetical protein SAMN05216486_1184 [bacterium JGI 053]|jgi:hypothetical protein|nr:hypothetical protein SAMN05216486_1184 [bacterium JGI 053]